VDALYRQIGLALQCGDLLLISGKLLISREGLLSAAVAITSSLKTGLPMKSSELRSQTALNPEVFEFALGSLVRERKVRLSGESVSIYCAEGESSNAETERLAAVANTYRAAGLAAPSVSELAQKLNLSESEMRRRVTLLQRNKTIVRMGNDNLFIHSEALNELSAKITQLRGSLIDVGGFKQLTGLSRKYAIPLLEYLDRERITRNQGDRRLVL